jgi:multiple sugar transport system ATP-binding protein
VQTRIEIAKLHNDTRATMIYVTHDQVEAMTLADRIVVLNAGRVEQVGTPLELYHHPANLFVAGFIGSPQMNLIPCQVAGVGPNEVLVSLPGGGNLSVSVQPDGVQTGEAVTLGIRPDHVRISPEGALTGRVELVEELGENHLLYVDAGQGRRLTLREPGDARHEAGSTVSPASPATCSGTWAKRYGHGQMPRHLPLPT